MFVTLSALFLLLPLGLGLLLFEPFFSFRVAFKVGFVILATKINVVKFKASNYCKCKSNEVLKFLGSQETNVRCLSLCNFTNVN